MEGYKIVQFLKHHIRLLLVLTLLLIITFVIMRHGFVTIEVTGSPQDNSPFSYKLLNQSTQKTTEIKTTATKVRKLVAKADYEVLVTKNGGSSFSVVKSPGWLHSKHISISLKLQKARQFVGDNPAPCMYYIDKLYSLACGGTVKSISVHVPANEHQPTYVTKNTRGPDGSLEAIVKTTGSNFAIVNTGLNHAAFSLNNGLALTNGVVLQELASNQTYSFAAFKQGFIAYDSTLTSVLYFSSPSAKPATFSLQSSVNNLKPSLLSVGGDTIVVVYSNAVIGEDPNKPNSSAVRNEVVIYPAKGNSRSYRLDKKIFTDVEICGTQKLCFLSNKVVYVYDTSVPKPRLLFTIQQANSIDDVAGQLLIARDSDLLTVDVDAQHGSEAYSFGGYQQCGSQNEGNDYLLCVVNGRSKKVALKLDWANNNSDSIDQKIAELEKLTSINNISINGAYIFISPAVPLTFSQSSGQYTYDPVAKAKATNEIGNAIAKIGIDRNVYKIINTVR